MLRNPVTSRYGQRSHAIKRCAQRYGIALSLEDYTRLCDRIYAATKGKGTRGVEFIASHPNVMFIWYFRQPLIVAWDEITCQIRTFLPREKSLASRAQEIVLQRTPRSLRWKVHRGLPIHGSRVGVEQG